MAQKLFLLCLLMTPLLLKGGNPLFGFGPPVKVHKNVFYAEWYGNGVYYSLNYERMFQQKTKMQKCVRAGMMIYPSVFTKSGWIFTFPTEMSVLVGKRRDKIELGIGNTFTTGKFYHLANDPIKGYIMNHYRQFILIARLGYRTYSENGLICRIGVLPLVVYKPGYISETANTELFGYVRNYRKNSIRKPAKYDLGISFGLSFGYSF